MGRSVVKMEDTVLGMFVGAGIALVSMIVSYVLMAWYIIKRTE